MLVMLTGMLVMLTHYMSTVCYFKSNESICLFYCEKPLVIVDHGDITKTGI